MFLLHIILIQRNNADFLTGNIWPSVILKVDSGFKQLRASIAMQLNLVDTHTHTHTPYPNLKLVYTHAHTHTHEKEKEWVMKLPKQELFWPTQMQRLHLVRIKNNLQQLLSISSNTLHMSLKKDVFTFITFGLFLAMIPNLFYRYFTFGLFLIIVIYVGNLTCTEEG